MGSNWVKVTEVTEVTAVYSNFNLTKLHFGGILLGKKVTWVTEVTEVTAISVTLT